LRFLWLFLGLICFCLSSSFRDEIIFKDFMTKYHKSYDSIDEYQKRMNIFSDNMDFIEKQNNRSLGYRVKMNKFGDLTSEEFRSLYLHRPIKTPSIHDEVQISSRALPTSWDWRSKGAVGPVADQGQCGTIFYPVVGAVEGCHKLSTGNFVTLSVQQVIDCSSSEGCDGGEPTDAYDYIMKNGGIDSKDSYPPSNGDCKYNKDGCASIVTNYTFVASGNENALQVAVYMTPVSVGIDASATSFDLYSSGVYYEPSCSSSSLDHEVLVVGWGVMNGASYWIVKNSWGVDWGMSGYILMARNKNNNCGIATAATYPIGCNNCS